MELKNLAFVLGPVKSLQINQCKGRTTTLEFS